MSTRMRWVLIILLLLLTIPSIAVLSILSIPRHIDPLTAKEEINIDQVISMLNQALEYNVRGDMQSAIRILNQSREVYIPQSIRDLYNRITETISRFMVKINETSVLLNNAEKSLKEGSIARANASLTSARSNIADLKIFLDQLRELARILTRSIPQVSRGFEEIYRYLNTTITNIESRYSNLAKQLEEQLEEGLLSISISINVYPRNITAGDAIRVEGSLQDEYGRPLPGRRILIHVGNDTIATNTDRYGSFGLVKTIQTYVDYIYVYAEYLPNGSDANIYKYGRSENITINIFYIKPVLKATANTTKTVPGGYVRISLESDTDLVVGLRSSLINVTAYNLYKRGDLVIKIPENATEGIYNLTIYSYPKGMTAPREIILGIQVYRMGINISIEKPDYVFTGVGSILRIKPDQNATLLITLPPEVEINRVAEDSYALLVPHIYWRSYVDLSITAIPSDPGYRVTHTLIRIPVYNTMVVGAIISLIAVLSLSGYQRMREIRKAHMDMLNVEARTKSLGRGSIGTYEIPLFGELIRSLESLSGIPFGGNLTYREYLDMIRARIPGLLFPYIKELFTKIEAYLYGGPLYRDLLSIIRSSVENLVKQLRRYIGEQHGS